ncbi:hypothetical protein F0562_003577 [Nyssa sinensis]|uniref:F-box protein GID2 n=1 Tax=Nyssa sinensis TaxID=561372 RepID=A0A5J5BZS0_9ASTE|nr:hypothetical protein F0562_003577 [Nyssa sinensis]
MTKRALDSGEMEVSADEEVKRRKAEECTAFVNLEEDMLFEVLKHADARTLARAACVNKLWRRTAEDELLWEVICTRHCATVGCGSQQLRSVVLALGGFRRLHALCLWPLLKKARWGKDEISLSLSLLSIRYYEKMNFNSRGPR